jgi:Zn-dependent protease
VTSASVVLFVILAYSIILHEISHGYAALLNGDSTAKEAKRLTLNPIPHVDPVGTILLPAILILTSAPFFIGWAKPVPFNAARFRNWKSGVFTVAIAGPLTNVILALIFAGLLRHFHGSEAAANAFFYGASLNVMLALFNLLPIPPLDGSKALGVFFPDALQRAYFSIERFGFIIIAALLYFGILHRVLAPVYQGSLRFLFQGMTS